MRRALVDYGIMDRVGGGGEYWLVPAATSETPNAPHEPYGPETPDDTPT